MEGDDLVGVAQIESCKERWLYGRIGEQVRRLLVRFMHLVSVSRRSKKLTFGWTRDTVGVWSPEEMGS